MKIHDVIFIGFGPATIFSLLRFPQKNCLILEKGKSLRDRGSKEVLFGSGGAGAFSDSKLVNNPIVGGDIKNLVNITEELFYSLADDILEQYNAFSYNTGSKELKNWMLEDSYEIPSDKLKLLKSRVCHIGTNVSKIIFQNIEEYLNKKYELHFEEEVVYIHETNIGVFEVVTNKHKYCTKNIVIGVGKRSSLIMNLVKQLGLKSKPNLVQLGVRVECPNIYFKELIDRFYDFKIVQETKLGRWRTFCVCGKNAYVTVEKSPEFISANGAAIEGNNSLINFGIMGELKLDWDTKKQMELMQKTNNNTEQLLAQNIYDFIRGERSEKLNFTSSLTEEDYRLDNIWKYYPINVLTEMRDFIEEVQKVYPFNGHFFAPEIKLTNPLIEMNDKFEIYPGIHLVGDCSGYTRSIIQAGISGMLVGEYIQR